MRQAAALVALLDHARALAQIELDRARAGSPAPVLPDAAVEQAARMFLSNPSVRAAAGFLALSAE
jgi:hypothetical protein